MLYDTCRGGYQSHHTGIETQTSRCPVVSYYLSIAPYWNWNSMNSRGSFSPWTLSIAPYWNWNILRCRLIKPWRAINRTILELKLDNIVLYSDIINYQSHHTGIETLLSCMSNYLRLTINRTILELKLITHLDVVVGIFLSIAPYWNWNTGGAAGQYLRKAYQSHHTGIETAYRIRNRDDENIYQSHHTGIETRQYPCTFLSFLRYQSHHTGIETT